MRTEIEKKIEELNRSKVPIVAIKPSLIKYRDNTPFPEKLAMAEALIKGLELPEVEARRG